MSLVALLRRWSLGGVTSLIALGLPLGVGCRSVAPSAPPEAPQLDASPSDRSDAAGLLAGTFEQAQAAGSGPLAVVAFGAGSQGDRVGGFVGIDSGQCAVVFARGDGGIIDLDLQAYGDDGSQLGSDQAPDDLPTLLLCVQDSTRLYLTARVAQGEGLVAVGGVAVDERSAPSVALALGARSGKVEKTGTATTWPRLDELLASRRRRLGGRWVDQRKVAVPLDARVPTRLAAEIMASRCVDVMVIAADPEMDVQLTLAEESGRIVQRRVGGYVDLPVTVCSKDARRTVELTLRPLGGQGVALVVLSRSLDSVTRGDPRTIQLGAASKSSSNAELIEPALDLVRGRLAFVEAGQRGCARWELIGNAARIGQLRAWSPAGELLSDSEPPLPDAAWVCHEGPLRIEVEPETTQVVQLVRRQLLDVPLKMRRNGRAASLLLGEAERRWGPLTRGPAEAQTIQVAPQARTRLTLTSESGDTCRLVIAAAVAGDATLRLVVESSRLGEPSLAAEARGVVSQEVCGPLEQQTWSLWADAPGGVVVGVFDGSGASNASSEVSAQ